MQQIHEHVLRNWIPYKLTIENGEPLVSWLYVADRLFTEPFFEETIMRCKSHVYNSAMYKSVSSVDSMIEWADEMPDVDKVNFIFHVSRCGSTLLSQLIGLDVKYIMLSEVPFFDEILRLPYKLPAVDDARKENMLHAAIKLVGAKRTGEEKQLFIKTDSWHICFYEILRRLYPNVPFVLLYRMPDEVIYSHQKLRGMQAVPHVIEPEVFGFTEKEIAGLTLDVYTAKVLEKYMQLFEEVAAHDEQTLLLDYKQGAEDMVQQLANHVKIHWDEKHALAMQLRSAFHSKQPEQNFKKETKPNAVPDFLQHAMKLYKKLDEKRKEVEFGKLGVTN